MSYCPHYSINIYLSLVIRFLLNSFQTESDDEEEDDDIGSGFHPQVILEPKVGFEAFHKLNRRVVRKY